MKSKAYRAVAVNHLQLDRLLQPRHEPLVHAGLDVGKDHVLCVLRCAAHDFERPWPLALPSEAEQELAYQVEWLDGQRRQTQLWYGRLEALLSRHWPEATRLLPLTSGVLRRCLRRYGGPRRLAEDPQAADRLYRW